VRNCDACGSPKAQIEMGGASLCHDCDVLVRHEIERLRYEGKPVNVLHIAKRIFRENNSASNYLLRDIPEELWNKVRHRAVDEGCSLRDLVIKSLNEYLNREPK
jgi:hypothetical protein